MDTKKVLFLDIDGVMNTYYGFHKNKGGKNRTLETIFRDKILYKLIYSKLGKWLGKKLEKTALKRQWTHYVYTVWFWKALSRDEGFDPRAFFWLNELLTLHPDLQIVISSIWRMDGIVHLRRLLAKHGVNPGRIISATPRVDSYRGKEIAAWLNGFERNPELKQGHHIDDRNSLVTNTPHSLHFNVTKFAIVDDDSDMDPYKEFFVQTDGHDGITHRDFLKLDKILRDEPVPPDILDGELEDEP